MKSLMITVVAVSLISCNQSAVREKLEGTDSVMVQFFNENGMIYNAVTSTERSAINKLTSFMQNRQVTAMKCGSSGKVQFFAKHQLVLDATYHMITKDCRYFSYTVDGKLMNVAMSNEAADFIGSLKQDLP
jgi:hypothetical protein